MVWITGASSGIGEALAYELAKRGASLVLSARRVDKLMAVADKCHQLGSPDAEALKLDVVAFDSHKAIAQHVQRRFKKIDYLVNNAGRSQRALVESTELAVDKEMFELNVFGMMSVTKAVLPIMLQQEGGGVIVTTSSVAGKVGSPISATYSATKHAVQGFCDSLRMEVSKRNVRVVNVCPGPVQSEISLHAFTAVAGQQHGDATESSDSTNRMPAEKCAAYMAAAMWAELPEVWIAPQPILLFTYIGQYWRWLYFKLGPVVGHKRVTAFKAGHSGYGAVQNLWSIGKDAAGGASKKKE